MQDNYNIFSLQDGQESFFNYLLPDFIKNKTGSKYIGAINSTGKPAGVVAYSLFQDRTEIDYVGVTPKDRGKGLAGMLINALGHMLEYSNILNPLEVIWDNDTDPIIRPIMEKLKEFLILEDKSFVIVTPSMIKNSKICEKIKTVKKNNQEFFSLTNIQKKQVLAALAAHNYSDFIGNEEDCIKELCLCHFQRDNGSVEDLTSLIFFQKDSSGDLILSFLYVTPKDPMALGYVLGEALRRIDMDYGDKNITMTCVNQQSKNLVKSIFGEGLKAGSIYTAIRFGAV